LSNSGTIYDNRQVHKSTTDEILADRDRFRAEVYEQLM